MTAVLLVAADANPDALIGGFTVWPGVSVSWVDFHARHLRVEGPTCIVESLVNAHTRLGLLVEIV